MPAESDRLDYEGELAVVIGSVLRPDHYVIARFVPAAAARVIPELEALAAAA